MRHKYILRGTYIAVLSLFFFSYDAYSQVGIGNTDPSESSLLDIRDVNNNKGILIPRISIPDLNNRNPITTASAADESLLVYNTNIITGKGFYYWNGTRWMGIDSGKNWQLAGNAGTVPGTDFLGTTTNEDLRIKTNNLDRFNFTSNGRLRSYDDGLPNQPTYSWISDPDIGMYRIAANTLGFSTNGLESMRIIANGNVGIGATNPTQKLEVNGNLRLNGAFMPGNQSGSVGRVLVSQGATVTPTWGAEMVNINQIARYMIDPVNIDAYTTVSITVPVPGLTNTGTAIINLSGDWGIPMGDKLTIHNIEIRTGEIRFAVSNNTLWSNYTGVDFTVTIIR